VVKMTTTQIRAIAEAAITYHATMLGIVVLEPLIEGRRYDLVLDTGDLLLRTQCKWARRKGDVVVIRSGICRHTPNGYVPGTYSGRRSTGSPRGAPRRVGAALFRSPTSRVKASCTCVWRPLGTARSSLYTGPRTTGLGL
jgi:hypothetical protein